MKLARWLPGFAALISLLCVQAAHSDTIVTRNGATLIGEVKLITKKVVKLQTQYAGVITVRSNQIARLETDSVLTSRMGDGAEVSGQARLDDRDYLVMEGERLNIRAPFENLMAAWPHQEKRPAAARLPDERYWKYKVSADMTGRSGNVDALGARVNAEAALVSANDEFRFHVSIDKAEVNDRTTSDEFIIGTSYTDYVIGSWGWFASTEFERDPFESLDLRTSVSGGVSYRVLKGPKHRLELKAGLGYRHENLTDGTTQGTPTMDFELDHMMKFKPLPKLNPSLEMTNLLSITPSLQDLDDYLLVQDSGLQMPIGDSNWKLMLGVKNHYDNQPAEGREELDTTYYSRLLLDFD